MVGDGGQTTPAPWLTYTDAGCNVGAVSAANIVLENNNATRPVVARGCRCRRRCDEHQGRSDFAVLRRPDDHVENEQATISAVGTAGATGTGLTLTAGLVSAHAVGREGLRHRPRRRHDARLRRRLLPVERGRDSQTRRGGTAARTLARPTSSASQSTARKDVLALPTTPTRGPTTRRSIRARTTVQGPVRRRRRQPGDHRRERMRQGDRRLNITDTFNQCGFPGFDGALAKNTLG